MKKFTFSIVALTCSLFFVLLATAARIAPVNIDADGFAIKGYDPVAYFTLGHPTKGKSEFQLELDGAKWLFSSQEHLNLFQKTPEKFMPQYGGY